MENPASWKTAELVIEKALQDAERARRMQVVGGSMVITIANALRSAGLINDQDEPEIGWEKLREHWAKAGVRGNEREVRHQGYTGRPSSR